ncbi:hypothetical protein [Crocosphaera sp.]|uniref:hypothetical protein n=1 Tax=Crocosphaera sp. TaxID=2729996 RepID=UPI002618B4FB|nr:hypothetical protein [Crocosphaera sp.]MDJ0579558.1 hypothetical protein [Crocosphaera sp.]
MDKQIKSTRKLAIDDIYRIGTPDAAVKLVPFLWDEDEDFAIYVAWHLGVLLKKPEVEEKLSKYPLKSEQTLTDELTYIWRPFENNYDSALFTITSRLAYLIKVSSIENIPQPILPVDPRIIIPISAVETINSVKLPTKTDSKVDKLLAQSKITPELENTFKDKVDTLLGYQQLDNNWKIKLSSISPRLQLDLLHRLINSRSSSRSDWGNLYKNIKYKYRFQSGWHYYIVLGVSFILCLIAVIQLLTNVNDKLSWLFIFSSPFLFLLVFYFWPIIWQGIEEKLEAQLFLSFGLFGILTFYQKLKLLWFNKSVWNGITPLYNIVIKVRMGVLAWVAWTVVIEVMTEDLTVELGLLVTLIVFLTLLGVWESEGTIIIALALMIVFLTLMIFIVLTGEMMLQISDPAIALLNVLSGSLISVFLVQWVFHLTERAGIDFWLVIVAVAWVILMTLIVLGPIIGPGARVLGCGAVIVMVVLSAGSGLGVWHRAKDKIDSTRYLAIFAFPFFSTFPIVFGYCSYAFYDWFGLTWQQITIIWMLILGVCTVLWQWGQKLDYEARNPFKGILDTVKNDSDFF